MRKYLKNKDNRGIALVSVMIVMTVVMLMATLIVELAYTSLLSRRVNTKSTKNFYAAQSALDDMSTVLQSIAVYSAKELENSSSKTDGFIDVAERTLKSAANLSDSYITDRVMKAEDAAKLSKFFFDNLTPEVKAVLGTDTNGDGVYEYDASKLRVTAAMKSLTNGTKERGAITLTIELNYLDENGYMTNISTDLVMNNVVNRPPASAFSLASYSMFTGGGVEFKSNDDSNGNSWTGYGSNYGAVIQEGNAYVGTMANSSNAINIAQQGLIFEGNRVIINGDVTLFNGGTLSFPGGSSTSGENTMIDIRGTVYIDATSCLVLGKGVDLLVNDIKISPYSRYQKADWKNYATSMFDKNNAAKQYINAQSTTLTSSNYPYNESLATMKSSSWLSSDGVASAPDTFKQSKVSGCVIYTDGTRSYVAKIKYTGTSAGNDVYKLCKVDGDATIDSLILNRDDSLGPIAKATFWGYDGTTHTVDSELSNFVNLDVMYYQHKMAGGGGALDMGAPIDLSSGNPSVNRNQKMKFVLNGTDNNYYFNDITTVGSMTSSNYVSSYDSNKESLSGGNFSSGVSFNFNGINRNKVAFLIGDVDRKVEDGGAIVWANQWKEVWYHVSKSDYIGTLISAEKGGFYNMGQGTSVGYSLLHGNKESLKKLINVLKYIGFMKKDEIGNPPGAGNGAKYNGSDTDKLYGLGMLDSLYKGGLDAFLDEQSDEGAGGPVEFDVSSMYDFITIENWKTN